MVVVLEQALMCDTGAMIHIGVSSRDGGRQCYVASRLLAHAGQD